MKNNKLFEKLCEKAAEALAQADILLLVTGAGWGADSGLAVYNDIANVPAYRKLGLEYDDLCQPYWVGSDPAIFYGFWGQCFNDYRTTKPHEGFDIITRWRDNINAANDGVVASAIRESSSNMIQQSVEQEVEAAYQDPMAGPAPYKVEGTAGAFYCFTSNVDGHFYDKLEANEIHDCHGCIELWQCSDPDCDSGIWRAPMDFEFAVDQETMLAPSDRKALKNPQSKEQKVENPDDNCDDTEQVARIGHTTGTNRRGEDGKILQNMPPGIDTKGWLVDEDGLTSNWPQCGHCRSLARPAILMFGDFGWKYDEPQNKRWEMWKEAVYEMAVDKGDKLKVCVVEVGCGMKVQTCRRNSEEIVDTVRTRGADVTLIRINPDFPLTDDADISDVLIPIKSRGLEAIKRIDEIYSKKREEMTR